MTISAFEIYLIMLCDDIKGWMVVACLASAVLCIFGIGTWCVLYTEQKDLAEKGLKIFKCSVAVLVIAALLNCVVPSTKTAVMMTSLPAIINSTLMQKAVPEGLRGLWKGLGLVEQGVMETGGMLEQDTQRESALETVNSSNGE